MPQQSSQQQFRYIIRNKLSREISPHIAVRLAPILGNSQEEQKLQEEINGFYLSKNFSQIVNQEPIQGKQQKFSRFANKNLLNNQVGIDLPETETPNANPTLQKMEYPKISHEGKGKIDIDKFVMKSQESHVEGPSHERSYSKTHRYEFRKNQEHMLPSAGNDPTEKKPLKKGLGEGYYYHVTSYVNLASIFNSGLNPASGGGLGGSSYQNADSNMNTASAKDSQSKVFVATVKKLPERYLSLRLRMEDLFRKHGKCIIETLQQYTKLPEKTVRNCYEVFLLGEEPCVLRFKNEWESGSWTPDPIDKQAYALVNQPVLPAKIECLTIEGWVPLTIMSEVVSIFQGKLGKLRNSLLSFFGKYNESLEKMGEIEGLHFIPNWLEKELEENGIARGKDKD